MYQSDTTNVAVPRARLWTAGWPVVPPTVWYLGFTSLLTDISSEMVASVLPMYLMLHLNLSPLAFGAFDGLYNSAGAFARWGSGVLADRRRHCKGLAAVGYGVSAICRLAILAVGSS